MSIVEDLRAKVKEQHIKEPEECKELLISSIKQQMDLGENAMSLNIGSPWSWSSASTGGQDHVRGQAGRTA